MRKISRGGTHTHSDSRASDDNVTPWAPVITATTVDHINAGPPATPLTNTKLERLARPSFDQDMSQSEWLFDLSQWNTYISQSIVSKGAKVQQLNTACKGRLLRHVYDAA